MRHIRISPDRRIRIIRLIHELERSADGGFPYRTDRKCIDAGFLLGTERGKAGETGR